MGVLAPLYLAGLAALSLPLLLHLIRRTPRGRQVFSSLLFLAPSPPRLTRRSRLDQILLLLLRLAALALLAFAFARPFLRQSATLAFADLPSRRVAMLVDVSASMRRGDLWQQALRLIDKELDDLSPHDEVALFAFDQRLQTIVDFDADQPDSSLRRPEIVRQHLKSLAPAWTATDLGAALTAVASELDTASDVRQLAAEPQIVVISDFQMGASTEALQSFSWPKRIRVIPRVVSPARTTNAHAHPLINEEDAPEAELRVRVVNAADSSGDQFFVRWAKDHENAEFSGETAVYVPPGQSRVVRLPRPPGALEADRIILRGDDHDFDNTYYVVPPIKQNVKLLYVGSDAADDQRAPQYYLRLATAGDPLRQVEVQPLDDDDVSPLNTEPPPRLVVVTRAVSAALVRALEAHVRRGGTLLLVPRDREAAVNLLALLEGVGMRDESTSGTDYLLLGEIDFSHPLFAPFAGPRYSDFTKIHFWKHRPLEVTKPAEAKVVARFDNGDPALLEKVVGIPARRDVPFEAGQAATPPAQPGHVYLLASGWNPDDSQLALSSKFVPLIAALLDEACGTGHTLASVVVAQPVPLPAKIHSWSVAIQKPDGTKARLDDSPHFSETEQPGIYRTGSGAGELRFAVNLAQAESNTAPLDLEQLEQLGVPFSGSSTRAERLDRIRQERDTELESRQKIWRWLIVGALAILIAETIWAGRAARQIARTMEVAT